MSGMFGGGTERLMREQMAAARRNQQMANEEAGRARQKAERGAAPGRRVGRSLLIGRMGKSVQTQTMASAGTQPTSGGGGGGGGRHQ